MKKNIITIFITIIFVSMLTTLVYAADSQIIINGDSTAKLEETKELTIKISSNEEIGIISGKIESNSNITNMTVTGINSWNLTYNKDTGVFNIYKAEGAKTEDIMNIKYTTGNTEGTGSITLSNIKMTTINYESKEIANVTKNIVIAKEQEGQPEEDTLVGISITKTPTRTTYTVGEKCDTTGMEVTATYSDGSTKKVTKYAYTPNGFLGLTDSKITITYTEGNITKTVEQKITVVNENKNEEKGESDNKANEQFPKTGISNIMLVIALLSVSGIAIVAYIKYRKYKNI